MEPKYRVKMPVQKGSLGYYIVVTKIVECRFTYSRPRSIFKTHRNPQTNPFYRVEKLSPFGYEYYILKEIIPMTKTEEDKVEDFSLLGSDNVFEAENVYLRKKC